MTDKKIHLKVITHEKILYEENVEELYVQSTDGRLGILHGHTPIVCTLDIGVTKVIKDKQPRNIATIGGILQFANNEAVILTNNAELDSSIDITRAKHAKERAEARLKAKDDNLDSVRAQVALSRAIARINAHDLKY